jgi:hypothetical protein
MDPTKQNDCYADIVKIMQEEMISLKDWAPCSTYSLQPPSPDNARKSTMKILEQLKQKNRVKK